MRNRKFRWAGVVMIALLALGATGCGSSGLFGRITSGIGNILTPNRQNDYAEQHIALSKRSLEYATRKSVVADETGTRRAGVLTDLQFNLFSTYEQNVNAAVEPVIKAMDEWGATGTKPAGLDAKVKTLYDAYDDMIEFIRTVKP